MMTAPRARRLGSSQYCWRRGHCYTAPAPATWMSKEYNNKPSTASIRLLMFAAPSSRLLRWSKLRGVALAKTS
jgi:hypothetical protein